MQTTILEKWLIGLIGLFLAATITWAFLENGVVRRVQGVRETANVQSGNSKRTNVNATYREDIAGCVGASNYTYSFYLDLRPTSTADIRVLLTKAGVTWMSVINQRSAHFTLADGHICEGLLWLRSQPDVGVADTVPYMPTLTP